MSATWPGVISSLALPLTVTTFGFSAWRYWRWLPTCRASFHPFFVSAFSTVLTFRAV